MKTITNCRACGGIIEELFSLGNLYVIDFPKEQTGYKAPLTLVKCANCALVQLKDEVEQEKMFTQFWYRSGISNSMRASLRDITENAMKRISLCSGDVVIDIGCNDGTLFEGYPNNLKKVGFEPSKNVALIASKRGDCRIINDYFKEFPQFAKSAKVITAIAMFYDLPNPNAFLQDVVSTLASDGIFIVQMNYLPAMLNNHTFDNICHEHLEYYSLTSLIHILLRNGLVPFRVEKNDVNGGSFRIYIKHILDKTRNVEQNIRDMLEEESDMNLASRRPYEDFHDQIRDISSKLKTLVDTLPGKIIIYGASTRGATILQLADIDRTRISYACDANEDKFGRLIVGSWIPIISKIEARKMKPDYFLVLPYHFIAEIMKAEQEFLAHGGKFVIPIPEVRIVP